MRKRFYIFIVTFCLLFIVSAFGQGDKAITVITEPKAIVWINDVRYGTTDEGGKLTIKNPPSGARKLRIRAHGFKEITQSLTATQKGEVKVVLAQTTDEAEIAFQEAEKQTLIDRQEAIRFYE